MERDGDYRGGAKSGAKAREGVSKVRKGGWGKE